MSTATLVELPTLDFVGELIGFPEAHHFALMRVGEDNDVLFRLRSLDVDGLEFVVAAPFAFFPGYAPELDDHTVQRLDIEDEAEVVVLVLLTLGDQPTDTTANLLAPLVVNTRTLRATQPVLAGPSQALREPHSAGVTPMI